MGRTRSQRKVGYRDFPRLTRFYGIPPDKLFRLPWWVIDMYADELPVLQAEEQMLAIMAADMPHAEQSSRKRVFRMFDRILARARQAEPAQKVDLADEEKARRTLAGLGIGFHRSKTREVES